MTDQVRFEHAERVRDFYRNQGAAKERERIIELLKRNIGWIEALEYSYWADELADLITGKDAGRDGETE
jgi:hypothetical protein